MKTRVKIKHDIPQEPLFKDDEGYIDGYVRGADDRPYAVVVVGNDIGLALLHDLFVQYND